MRKWHIKIWLLQPRVAIGNWEEVLTVEEFLEDYDKPLLDMEMRWIMEGAKTGPNVVIS